MNSHVCFSFYLAGVIVFGLPSLVVALVLGCAGIARCSLCIRNRLFATHLVDTPTPTFPLTTTTLPTSGVASHGAHDTELMASERSFPPEYSATAPSANSALPEQEHPLPLPVSSATLNMDTWPQGDSDHNTVQSSVYNATIQLSYRVSHGEFVYLQ